MKNQTRLLLVAAVIVVVLIIGAQYILQNQAGLKLPSLPTRNVFQPNESVVSPTQAAKLETVSIDFGNGQKVVGQVYTQNAYQALVQIAKTNNLSVTVKQYKYGLVVTKVDNTANSSSSAWMYLVNGKPGQIAADRYVIYPGDKVEWVYKSM